MAYTVPTTFLEKVYQKIPRHHFFLSNHIQNHCRGDIYQILQLSLFTFKNIWQSQNFTQKKRVYLRLIVLLYNRLYSIYNISYSNIFTLNMERDIEYEENNIGYDYQYPDGGIKCKNYELCECILPNWWFEYKGMYLCTNCHMTFGEWTEANGKKHTGKGILDISDNVDCPICLENKRGISQPKCDHKLCIDCFKRCYYGDDDLEAKENEPQFPYPDIEDEYYDDQDNSKWKIDYPLIEKYNEDWNAWDDNKRIKYNTEDYLRICALCRK